MAHPAGRACVALGQSATLAQRGENTPAVFEHEVALPAWMAAAEGLQYRDP